MQAPSHLSNRTALSSDDPFHTAADVVDTAAVETQLTSQGSKRRPFQTRRKERSCDNCKVRKTRCDARDDESCSACIAAGLPCTFSSQDHEGRKIGPTRRIRELEKTVEELTKKLQLSERQRKASQDDPFGGVASPIFSTGSVSNHRTETGSRPPRIFDLENYPLTSYGFVGESDLSVFHTSPLSAATHGRQQHQCKSASPPDGTTDAPYITWNPNAFGPGSAPQFIDTYKVYLQRQGLYAQHISGESANMYERADQVPLLSDLTPPPGFPALDLRTFLPDRSLANKLLEAFRQNIQNFNPIFYWPILERKFERAWSSPMWEHDGKVVNEVFCIVIIVLAVGSQLVKVSDIYPAGSGAQKFSQERQGWRFFELARKHLNLNNPVYTLEDATVLLLMSLYLDKATLPSPCWMICGAMARVCQDIGLHRNPPSGKFTNVQLECRDRLFWCAYVQDKRVSMKMGRPCILRSEDCDTVYPGEVDNRGIGTSLLCPHVGNVPVGGLPDESSEVVLHRRVGERALATMAATIDACKPIETIIRQKIGGSESPAEQIRRLQQLDEQLSKCWERLPEELGDTQRNEPLELPAMRALVVTQHARLILFRHFTDSAASKSLTAEFLNFCMEQSILVAANTARLLYRAQLNPDFNDQFGVVTDDLVHLHTFRVAIVLLLGLETQRPNVRPSDLNVCLTTLQAIARVHITGRRFLQLFKQFASIFRHPTAQVHIPEEHKVEICQPVAPRGPAPPPPSQVSDWSAPSYPLDYSQTSLSESPNMGPLLIQDPNATFGPEVLNRIGAGDWSAFQGILRWDPTFEAYVGGLDNNFG